MKILTRLFFAFCLLAAVAAAGGFLYLRKELSMPYPQVRHTTIVDIPRGLGTRELVRTLHSENVIANEYAMLAYIAYSGNRGRLRAGEYLFDGPMTIPEVVDKLVKGSIYLHKWTVPEGLTVEETAQKWAEQGFGPAGDFLSAAQDSLALVHDLDDKAHSLEGYLFPETYSFPKRTTARQAIEAMIGRFRSVAEKLKQVAPPERWPLSLRETVILASLVETEAAQEDERPLIASVYVNRLTRNILLQCDPTVIYALERANKYKGRLTALDLKFDSPYNTYVYPGLPPGPIANPGYRSLEAAIKPGSTDYLFFVRTLGGRHTFSGSLAAHNRAVAKYRAMKPGN